MGRKIKGLVGALLESERLKDVAECGRECEVCGWGCDDLEFEICCDCFSELDFRRAVHGEYGKQEQTEARETLRLAAA